MSFEDEVAKLKKEFSEAKESQEKDTKEIKEALEQFTAFMTSLQQASKEECEKKGGKWDDEKNTCTLPETKENVFSAEAFTTLSSHIGENLPFVHVKEDNKFEVLQNVNDVIGTLKELKVLNEILEQLVPVGEPPKTPSPKYPTEVIPLQTFLALLEKIGKPKETVEDCIKRLKGVKEQATPTTKEECEKAGGTWDEEKKTCKLPAKPAGNESLEGLEPLGILPSSTPTPLLEDQRAREFREKLLGKDEEKETD